MNQSLVSVIIPAFNSSKFIADTLKSVLQQTYSPIEIIVIDDGSTDNTAEIIKKQSQKIHYFYQKNSGLSASRNRGIELSRGEYIAFIDHDDYWYPEKIEKQLSIFQKKAAIGLVYTDGYITDLNGKIYHRFFSLHRPYRGKVLSNLIKINVIPWSSVMIRRNLLQHLTPFKEQLYIAEDYDFLLQAALLTEFDYVDKPLIRYQRHESNLSKKERRSLEEILWVLENFAKTVKDEYTKKIINHRFIEIYLQYNLLLLLSGKLSLFKMNLKKLLSKKPNYLYLLYILFATLKGKIINRFIEK